MERLFSNIQILLVLRLHQSIKNIMKYKSFILSLFVWYSLDLTTSDFQFLEEKSWINDFIKFKLGVDGISILFIILTTFITPICIISCVNSVKTRVKEFLIAILILETFMLGVFCSLDLVVFYLFFEAGLIPMSLIIGVTGLSIFVFYQLWYFFSSQYYSTWFESMNNVFPLFWIVFFILSIFPLIKKIPSLIVGGIGLSIFLFYQI